MKERIDKANAPDLSSGEINRQKSILENLQKQLQAENDKKQKADQHAQKGLGLRIINFEFYAKPFSSSRKRYRVSGESFGVFSLV